MHERHSAIPAVMGSGAYGAPVERAERLLSSAASRWGLAGLIVLLFASKLHLLFLQNVNWDEFLYLAKIYAAERGELSSVLQSGYVHAFSWLQSVSGNEIDQIMAARVVMFALQAGTCGLIFAVGRKVLGSAAAAMIGMLVYLTFSFVVDHGTEFRADPIAVFLLMAAVWLVVRDHGGRLEIVAAGLLTGLAGMVTIKSALYVPTLALAVLCLREPADMRRRIGELVLLGGTALATFLALYFAHRYSLAGAAGYSAADMVARSADKLIMGDELFPRALYIDHTITHDALAWFLLLTGFAVAVGVALTRGSRRQGVGLIGLGLPLLSLVFYRNAFPYYFVFMLAAPAVLAACLVAYAENRLERTRPIYFRVMIGCLVAMLAGGMIGRYLDDNVDRTVAQRQIVDTIHRMFPEPVPYIDRCSMIGTFPKVGFFMSTWGMQNYLDRGQPIMRDLLMKERPVFLIGNVGSLILYLKDDSQIQPLLPEDSAVLRDNFVRHWGVIWVAGKRLAIEAAGKESRFEILIPGTYTVDSEVPVVIDGIERAPGDRMELAQGEYTLYADVAPATVKLRWGGDLYRPDFLPDPEPVFVRFRGLR